MAGVEVLTGGVGVAGYRSLRCRDEFRGEGIFLGHRLRTHPPRQQIGEQPGEPDGIEILHQIVRGGRMVLRDAEQAGRFHGDRVHVREMTNGSRCERDLIRGVGFVARDVKAVVERSRYDRHAVYKAVGRSIDSPPRRHLADARHESGVPSRGPRGEQVFRFVASAPDGKVLKRMAGEENGNPLVSHAGVFFLAGFVVADPSHLAAALRYPAGSLAARSISGEARWCLTLIVFRP